MPAADLYFADHEGSVTVLYRPQTRRASAPTVPITPRHTGINTIPDARQRALSTLGDPESRFVGNRHDGAVEAPAKD